MAAPPPQDLTYQRCLRALGTYLDQHMPHQFRILEFPEGFSLVIQLTADPGALQEFYFPRKELLSQTEGLLKNRRIMGGHSRSKWRLCNAGYQDFLRALGFELDDSQARSIVIDELEDGLLVTYSYIDPSQGFQWRKQMIVLNRDAMRGILQGAKDRRHRRSILRRH